MEIIDELRILLQREADQIRKGLAMNNSSRDPTDRLLSRLADRNDMIRINTIEWVLDQIDNLQDSQKWVVYCLTIGDWHRTDAEWVWTGDNEKANRLPCDVLLPQGWRLPCGFRYNTKMLQDSNFWIEPAFQQPVRQIFQFFSSLSSRFIYNTTWFQ